MMAERDRRPGEPGSAEGPVARMGGWLDRAEDLVEALALRGEELERKQRARLERRLDRVGRRLARLRDRLAEEAEGFVEGTWHALGVPTRSDLQELTRSVERLTREVERLAGD